MTAQDILHELGCDDLKPGKSRKVLCPLHDDTRPSLSVTVQGDGKATFYCHAGCGRCFSDLVAHFNGDSQSTRDESSADASDESPEGDTSGEPLTLAEYARERRLDKKLLRSLGVRDAHGGVAFRFEGGQSKVRYRDPKYRWVPSGKNLAKQFPLWPTPPDTCAEEVWITCGETDAVTARMLGHEAYAITGGESAGLDPRVTRSLIRRGAKRLVLVGDADSAGRAWMAKATMEIGAEGVEVVVLNLRHWYEEPDFFDADRHPVVKDLNDHWRDLEDVDALNERLDSVRRHVRSRVRVYTMQDLRSEAARTVDWVVPELVAAGEKIAIVGFAKTYKTFMALNLARAITTGERFLGREEWRAGTAQPVVFLEEEGDSIKFAQRLGSFPDDAPFYAVVKAGFTLLDPAMVDWLISLIDEREARLVCLDPWQRVTPGIDENDATKTGPAWDAIHRITLEVPTCAVLLIHHAGKAGGVSISSGRGSSRFPGEVDVHIAIGRDEADRSRLIASIDGRLPPIHMLEDEGDGPYLNLDVDPLDPIEMTALGFTVGLNRKRESNTRDQVLAAIVSSGESGISRTALAETIGVTRPAIARHIAKLAATGAIRVAAGTGRTPERYWSVNV